jgi:hypothetical protein
METRDFKIIVFFTTARMTQFAAELFNKMKIEAKKGERERARERDGMEL